MTSTSILDFFFEHLSEPQQINLHKQIHCGHFTFLNLKKKAWLLSDSYENECSLKIIYSTVKNVSVYY